MFKSLLLYACLTLPQTEQLVDLRYDQQLFLAEAGDLINTTSRQNSCNYYTVFPANATLVREYTKGNNLHVRIWEITTMFAWEKYYWAKVERIY